jgi:glycerol uptake facilitator-like aquaporin
VTDDLRPPVNGDQPAQRPDSVTSLARRVVAELVGTAFLVAGVLVALILALGPASGAHFNPAVTLADRVLGGIDTRGAASYIAAQTIGAILGCMLANLMFDLPAVDWSTTERSAGNLWLAEGVATLGLLVVIFGVVRSGRATVAAFAVAGYIAGAYYFTSSTSFANPAVTIGRAFSDTFAGIAPGSVPAFIAAQLVGAAVAVGAVVLLYPTARQVTDQVAIDPRPAAAHGDDRQ